METPKIDHCGFSGSLAIQDLRKTSVLPSESFVVDDLMMWILLEFCVDPKRPSFSLGIFSVDMIFTKTVSVTENYFTSFFDDFFSNRFETRQFHKFSWGNFSIDMTFRSVLLEKKFYFFCHTKLLHVVISRIFA